MLYFTLSITALCGIVLLIQAIFGSHKYKNKDTNKSLSGLFANTLEYIIWIRWYLKTHSITRLDDNIRAVDIEQIMERFFYLESHKSFPSWQSL